MNLWCARQVERKTELLTNVGSGVAESRKREPVFFFISRNGDKNLSIPAIVRKANVSHGHHRQPWVFEFIPDNLGNLLTNNVCNSLWATHGLKQ
jgi:hypothetical protein